MLNETSQTILVQVSLMLGRMARTDYPTEWPGLFDALFHMLPGVGEPVVFALHHVVKALTSQKIGVGRAHTEQVAPRILATLYPLFLQQTHALYLLKCIRNLLVFGVKQVDHDAEPFLARLPELFSLYYAKPDYERHFRVLGKLVLDLQERHGHPWLLYPGMSGVVHWHAQAILSKDPVPTKVLLLSFAILKCAMKSASECVEQKRRRSPQKLSGDTSAQIVASEHLLPPTLIASLLEKLFFTHLQYSPDAMALMEDDPYAFVIEEDQDHWEYSVRGCAARLLMETVRDYPEESFQYILPLLSSGLPQHLSVVSGWLLLADQLQQAVPFLPILTHTLLPWVQAAPTPLLCRLVCQSIGAYVTVNVPRADRPLLYTCLMPFLHMDHPCVHFAAADAFRVCVDDWDFDPAAFLPYLDAFLHRVLALLATPDFALRSKLAHTLAVLFERMGEHMAAFAPQLFALLPQLWDQAAAHDPHAQMFQASVMRLVLTLIESLRTPFSPPPVMANLLDTACANASSLLVDEALPLWHGMLTYATAPILQDQMRWLPGLLEQGSEHLPTVVHLIVSYLLLDPTHYLDTVGEAVFEAIVRLLPPLATPRPPASGGGPLSPPSSPSRPPSPSPSSTSSSSATAATTCVLRPQASRKLAQALEMYARVAPERTHVWFERYGLYGYFETTMVQDLVHPLTLIAYWTVLARLLLHRALMCGAGGPRGSSCEGGDAPMLVSVALVERWLERWEQLGHLYQRKLHLLALTVVCAAHVPRVAQLWTEFLHEVHETRGDAPVYWTYHALDEDTPETHRYRTHLATHDPVHTCSLIDAIRHIPVPEHNTMHPEQDENVLRWHRVRDEIRAAGYPL